MGKVLVRKALRLLWMLAGISAVSFAVIHLAPGTPGAGLDMNPAVSLETREKLTRLYGLDHPLRTQFTEWAWKAARFDFGRSLIDNEKVNAKIAAAIPVTLGVNGLSLLLAFLIGIPAGSWMAARQGSRREGALSGLFLALYSLPGFWLAMVLMSFFAVHFQVLPVSGLHSLFHEEWPLWRQWLDLLRHLVLPVGVIALAGAAAISRYVKAAMLEALSQDSIRAARARGIPERRVLMNHALRNALLPVITLVGLSVPALLGGSVVLESVFAIPGMGRLFFLSVFQRDYPVIMGVLTLGAVLTLAGNALADLAYAFADPRIRREGRSK